MSSVPQFFCRQPKTVSLIEAQPVFNELQSFTKPTIETRVSQYSPNGEVFAYTQPSSVFITNPASGSVILEIDVKEVFDLQFSPKGTFLTTWSRPVKADDETGNWKDNVNIFKLDIFKKTYTLISSYLNKAQSGWRPQYTHDESKICKMLNQFQIDFFSSSGPLKKPLYSLNVKEFGKIQSFQVSPGLNPSIAIFIPAQNGKPANIRVYSLPNLKTPTSQKQFFKGETCQFTWNALGTSILALVSTDVDSSNKSYYGETSLYLLGISGAFDQKISLDKEGPIHDITWSPTSREFAVIYGYMPTQTTFFDARGNSIHSLPPDSRNTIQYSPHAKFILVGGFGNLQGKVDILDRQNKFKKIASFEATNTTFSKWSPDGRYILTATTSPRLRVDNCAKVWYYNGTLVYVKEFSELYTVDWRFQPLTAFPPIDINKESCTAPHISAIEFNAKRLKVSSADDGKPRGAYRPPHARNAPSSQGTLTLAQREAQQLRQGKSVPGFAPRKTIPGAVPVDNGTASKNKKRRNRNKKKEDDEAESAAYSPAPSMSSTKSSSSINGSTAAPGGDASMVLGGVFSLEEKKIRNLLKKLRAIEALKVKQEKGDFLEDTQVLKIKTEPQVRKELESLGWSEDQQ